jgi:hypothetical protein
MSAVPESAESRQFLACSVAYSPSWEKLTGKRASMYMQAAFWLIVLLGVLMAVGTARGIKPHFPSIGPAAGYGVLAGSTVVGVGIGAYLFWRSRRKYLVTVSGDEVTIDRRGAVYSFSDSHLSLWGDMGVALHLQRGRHRFLLGGRDRRVGPGQRSTRRRCSSSTPGYRRQTSTSCCP